MGKSVAVAAIALVFSIIAIVLWFIFCYVLSTFNHDKSLGGAYVAMAVLSSPLVAIISGIISAIVAMKFLSE